MGIPISPDTLFGNRDLEGCGVRLVIAVGDRQADGINARGGVDILDHRAFHRGTGIAEVPDVGNDPTFRGRSCTDKIDGLVDQGLCRGTDNRSKTFRLGCWFLRSSPRGFLRRSAQE